MVRAPDQCSEFIFYFLTKTYAVVSRTFFEHAKHMFEFRGKKIFQKVNIYGSM